ncbi:PadR family transcriptional regulator [Candidatus Bathyarchaeota archaeon]|nr:PadR family transcriptional regulator [Candidatus Bathyarchaeota archaeon]
MMNGFIMKKVDKQLTKGLLDLIVLGMLKTKSTHGYGIISSIRKNFGIYFGPSTIYPFLKNLEDKGYIKSQWDMNHDRPRKVFSITPQGTDILTGTEQSFRSICLQLKSLGIQGPTLSVQNQKPNAINPIGT